jgi:hypothetical protein
MSLLAGCSGGATELQSAGTLFDVATERQEPSMKHRTALGSGLMLLALGVPIVSAWPGLRKTSPDSAKTEVRAAARVRVQASYGKLPLAFDKNLGQTDPEVRFVARSRGGTAFVTASGGVFALAGDPPENPQKSHAGFRSPTARRDAAVFRMKLVGANRVAEPVGLEELQGKANYFIGNDPAKWRSNVPTYAKVKLPGIYPGVDLVYYGSRGQLEYDFIVAPDADPAAIRVAFEGVDDLQVNKEGDLVLRLAGREVLQRRPLVYEEDETGRRELGAAYALVGRDEVAFRVPTHDSHRRLVIDPVLVYSTFLGGSQENVDFPGQGIAVDSAGSAYVTGVTGSANFPTTPAAFQTAIGGDGDAFVAKLSADGSALVYSTYLGGSSFDHAFGIAVDGTGSAYVTGRTDSSDFPTVNPFQAAFGGLTDAFVTKLSADGSKLVYSTYLGGSNGDEGHGVAVDSNGSAYVTGTTDSTNLPTTPAAFQTTFGGVEDAFVAKLSADGSKLVYSTYLGGSDFDRAYGIAVDSNGSAYVTGGTNSANFPTTPAAFQTAFGGKGAAFVTKLSADGSALVYSTYLGGSLGELGLGIAVDGKGDAYVTGATISSDFPTTARAFQTTYGGLPGGGPPGADAGDAFVTKLNASGSALVYSTYLGGSQGDIGRGIAVDGAIAYVTGTTSSTDFPTKNTLQPFAGGGTDAFVTVLNANGRTLIYSTYLGGSDSEQGAGIAVDSAGNAYVIGSTSSSDFPTANPFQGTNRGGNAFVAKVAP